MRYLKQLQQHLWAFKTKEPAPNHKMSPKTLTFAQDSKARSLRITLIINH
jgi:hypothetical protein